MNRSVAIKRQDELSRAILLAQLRNEAIQQNWTVEQILYSCASRMTVRQLRKMWGELRLDTMAGREGA